MKNLPTLRDILIFETDDSILVTAVDSCGGIGVESGDMLKADPVITGMFTARVALLEIMAVGARPLFASVAITGGPDTTAPLMAGVRMAFGEEFPIVISTEKNMPTNVTGLGVTLTGSCPVGNLFLAGAKAGDTLYCAGFPLVGGEVLKPNARIFEAEHIDDLLADPSVHAILPVGSRGIAAEATILADESKLRIRWDEWNPQSPDLKKSAGPATCAVFATSAATDLQTRWKTGLPVTKLGTLY